MAKQLLSECERKKIRSDLHGSSLNQNVNFIYSDKIDFFIKYTKGKNVLDLGSVDHHEDNSDSKHWLFKALQDNSNNIVGLDYYQKGVLALRDKGYNITYGDAQNFNFDTQFDVVTAGDLIEHLPNLDGFLGSVRNVLSPGGVLVISTPNPWCWKYFLYHCFRLRLRPLNKEHVSWFCIQSLTQLLARYGFEEIESHYSSHRLYERLVPLPSHIKNTTLNMAFRLELNRTS